MSKAEVLSLARISQSKEERPPKWKPHTVVARVTARGLLTCSLKVSKIIGVAYIHQGIVLLYISLL